MKRKSFAASIMVCFSFLVLFHALPRTSECQDVVKGQTGDNEEGVKIVEEKGPNGHQTIGIVENSVAIEEHKVIRLTFRRLMTWQYDDKKEVSPPKAIKTLNDRRVRLTGFMYPLQEGEAILYFCLLRTTQTCCYGPRPQYNQYVLVEMKKPTKFYRLDPVSCTGIFKVEPTPEEGFIYRMEGETCNASAP